MLEVLCFILGLLVLVFVILGVGTRGKPLQSDAREIVCNVHKFFVEEYDALKVGNPTINIVEVAKQTPAACGVSERTVYRILNEKREADESGKKVSTPGKKRPKRTPTKTNIL